MGIWKDSKEEQEYIKEKLRVLKDFGLTDKAAIKDYLEEKLEELPDNSKRNIRIDNICRQLITNFLDGDHTFVKKG